MERPTSVTVFGILNIVFAGLGLIAVPFTVALFFVADSNSNPVVKLIRENAVYGLWIKASIPLSLLACVALLCAGIGLLKLKSWARSISLGYAFYAIAMGVIGQGINFVYVVRPMLAQAANSQGDAAATGAAVGGALGGMIGGCFGLIYPILLLIFMTRPKVVAAFQPTGTQISA